MVGKSDGGYVLAGETQLSDTGNIDFWLAKTDEYGIIPELPSWIPMLIIPSLLAVAVAIYKRRMLKTAIHNHAQQGSKCYKNDAITKYSNTGIFGA